MTKPVAAKAPKKKGGPSAAGRARLVAAQKARWAKIKAAKPAVPGVKPKWTRKGRPIERRRQNFQATPSLVAVRTNHDSAASPGAWDLKIILPVGGLLFA
jgi:hypothetical protein